MASEKHFPKTKTFTTRGHSFKVRSEKFREDLRIYFHRCGYNLASSTENVMEADAHTIFMYRNVH